MNKPPLDRTHSDLVSLTTPQLKRLLLLASASSALLDEPDNPTEVRRLLAELSTHSGQSGELLLDRVMAPTTPLSALYQIKDLAKQLANESSESAHGEAAKLLYHVVVAAAYGRRGVDISSRPLPERMRIYRRLAVVFHDSAIGDVFRRAVSHAQRSGL